MTRLDLRTQRRTQMIDLTPRIEEAVKQSGVKEGFCFVFVPHTTAALTINEHADPSVIRDLEKAMERLAPWNDSDYTHMEGNSAAHIKTSLLTNSQWLIIENGQLQMGTWQGVFFCEFDGPRQRQVWLKVVTQPAVDDVIRPML